MKKLIFGLVFSLFASQAQAIPLSSLVAGGSITVHDKLFDQWEVLDNDTTTGTVDLSNIDVTGLGGDPLNPGLQYTFLQNEGVVTGDSSVPISFLALSFRFHVTVLDPSKKAVDVELDITGGSLSVSDINTNDLGFSINEDVGTAAGMNDLAILGVEFSALNGALTSNQSDSANFAQQNGLWVDTGILVYSVVDGDIADLQSFTQHFSQIQVPEPGTLALFGLGLAGLGFARRRKVA